MFASFLRYVFDDRPNSFFIFSASRSDSEREESSKLLSGLGVAQPQTNKIKDSFSSSSSSSSSSSWLSSVISLFLRGFELRTATSKAKQRFSGFGGGCNYYGYGKPANESDLVLKLSGLPTY